MNAPHPAWRRIAAARLRQRRAEARKTETGVGDGSIFWTDRPGTTAPPQFSCKLPRLVPGEEKTE